MEEKRDGVDEKMSERTPLLQNVPVAEHRERYPHQRLRRYCTIALATFPVLLLIAALISLAVTGSAGRLGDHQTRQTVTQSIFQSPDLELPHATWPESEGIRYEELKETLLNTPDGEKAREWSKYYTAGPHLAGKNKTQADWTRDLWEEFGVHHAEVVAYDVYINYPLDNGLALLQDGKVKFRASLEEDIRPEDPTTSLEDRVPVFHGYSASGNVTGQYVYANYGTFQDYEDLINAGISLEGKIALVKYGGIFRGLKVKRASELGAIGVVMYSDPGDDGEVTEKNGLETYPDGPARNPSSVQRGSCQYLCECKVPISIVQANVVEAFAPGDPTTIGYPSKPGAPRQSPEGKIPDIPSLPISYQEALPLLKALNGHGPNVTSFPDSWQANNGLDYKGVDYNIGPSPKGVTLNLYNKQEYVTTPLWNTIGVINGTVSDEVVVIGNHRDAWIAGGAGDPNSGSAALNEVIRSFGKALKAGWKPHRTIVFASWDGEEYGLIGSTEWVEDYLPWLSGSTIAYINVDVGARGPHFMTAAAPLINKAIYEVTSQIPSPNQTVKGQTVRDLWDGHIDTMGSGSDFTAFQDFAGISSIDVGFGAGPNDPVYHYHSNYDSFYWMDKFGDPGFQYHITIAKIISLLAAKLVEEPIVQFNASDYAVGLAKYLSSVKTLASQAEELHSEAFWNHFRKIENAIAYFQDVCAEFDSKAARLEHLLLFSSSSSSEGGKMTTQRKADLYSAVRATNTKYKFLERQFLHPEGLDSRSWFKHVVFAPGRWTGYAGATFPGLVEAIEDQDPKGVEKWAGIITGRVYAGANLLLG
ncbi:Zn-dependent exopeptidase [Lecanosticta acicola]|uniref:Zn-dependent exopeptidase n=1 Tax=Lecanosticta acicola TaxID=111012 RepID=A0AAI9ECW2_9PEZI|nr:Zn-dependent exopeptidase [Lecanosticta acicola]